MKWWVYPIVGLLIIFAAFAPYLFSHFYWGISFSDTGQVGDTIGGTTAPIIGLLSAILLFYTLWEQIKFNKKQKEISADEQFKSTFFNLLQVQRDIIEKISGVFTYISAKDVTHIITQKAEGLDFFKAAKYQLFLIFKSLDNDKFTNGYNNTNAQYAESDIENTWYRDYGGSDLPYDIEAMWDSYSNNARMVHILAYTSDSFKISKKWYKKYHTLSKNKQIGWGYAYFFYKHECVGYYFRHLYHILKYIKRNEDEKILMLGKNPNQNDIDLVRKEYRIYASFIQAQMSIDELLLLFYNSFTFKKAQELIIHYDLLENLTVQNLISSEHNCIPEIKLKDKKDIFTNLVKGQDRTH